MKRVLVISATSVVLAGIVSYFLLFGEEVDDNFQNGPIQVEPISVMEQIPLFEGVLAAGISWDYDEDRFFLSTDQPHRLFAEKIASFYVINNTLDKILITKELNTDGDLEGIAYIGDSEVAVISEAGTIYYLKENKDDNEWENTHSVSVFNGDGNHKLGSLAYDPINKLLYSAEKEGQKIVYTFTREGLLIDSIEFNVDGMEQKREFDLDNDYTIAGMSFANQHLYIFSEAYSTLFKFDPATQHTVAAYGIEDVHESAGITMKDGAAYLVGDFEDYLPAPNFYKVTILIE
ncbi:MAG: SdiA-regulated domain-containing protein [Gammaproteobacteria bacterium]|nr:SdiA-regulated domain-containing protein [Gammaproteobacteria bacterium]